MATVGSRTRRGRRFARTAFTKSVNQLVAELDEEAPALSTLQCLFNLARCRAEELFNAEDRYKEELLDASDAEEEFEKFIEESDEYRNRWETVKFRAENIISKLLPTEHAHQSERSTSQGSSSFESLKTLSHCSQVTRSHATSEYRKSNIRLPKLELRKYNGDLKGWIAFWGQFQQIDGDLSIDEADKFQYLIQATEEGSPARRLVESFPPSTKNYKKAISSLRERFARDDLLIETYVRELLHLVSNQNKNKAKLSELYVEIMTQVKALETLGVTSQKYAAMLFPLVESTIPEDILKAWERSQSDESSDNLESLLKFLKREVRIEERLNITRRGVTLEEQSGSQPTASCLASTTAEESRNKKLACVWCDKTSHLSTECYKAINMTLKQRKKFLEQKKGCQICLKIGHNERRCFYKSRVKCVACGQKHQTLFCPNVKSDTSAASTTPEKQKQGKAEPNHTMTNYVQSKTGVPSTVTLLQTLTVKITNGSTQQIVRAFIDSGAQHSYILGRTAIKLNLKPTGKQLLTHCLFGGIETKLEEHEVYEFIVEGLDTDFRIKMTALQKDAITGHIPRLSCSHKMISQLKKHDIKLSDCGNDAPEVALLMGADYLGALITEDMVKFDNNVVAIRTNLGWTIQGPVSNACHVTSNVAQANLSITELWDLETLGIKDPAKTISHAESAAKVLENFKATISVNEEGRYEVNLPWKITGVEILDNRGLAEARLHSTTKKLLKMNEVEAYDKVFKEWLQLNIIEVTTDDRDKGHYLSHHAVIKESSLTTRVRPVFNASAKDNNGVSLNELLDKGVNYLEVIPKLLYKFRKHAIGVIADIKKAFLQISIKPEDRSYLKFLWWKDKEMKEIIVYRHRRVVFGLTSSPFLLAATIIHHLEKNTYLQNELSEAARLLLEAFYVDNCVISLETESEARKFIEEAKRVMLKGKFELRGWVTAPMNYEEMTEKDRELSVLGMVWNTEKDTLRCRVESTNVTEKPTQRHLMSVAQKVFDPIGITCPATLIPKLLLQKSHEAHCKLDAHLPQEIVETYSSWLKEVHELKECVIPRRLTKASITETSNSIHVFGDASGSAYAVCIFLRSEARGQVSIELIAAKSRVAPLEKITIPRLELLAALIASRLHAQVKEGLELNCDTYFWTDSTVVLTWITTKGDWGIWVKNRVKEIRELTNIKDWRHLPGSFNPADLPSRGCFPKTLKESKWWEGPSWLRLDSKEWPKSDIIIPEIDQINNEKEKTTTLIVTTSDIVEESVILRGVAYFSQFPKMVRTVAWILRFMHNCRQSQRERGDIKFVEYEKAENILLRLVQQEKIKGKSINLQTFTDEAGILRVRTKLLLTDETQTFKTPMLLPNNHFVVQRLVEQAHRLLKHVGVGTMITHLREHYWIIAVRRVVKSVIRRCLVCKKDKSKPVQLPQTAPLPIGRTKPKATFEVTGIDLAGPLLLRSKEKVWIVLFTCAVFRAAHLELTYSLSTEAFLMALRRFIARRGRPLTIYTDNGTNFHGAENQMRALDWQHVIALHNVRKIKWIFNPPAAPWWGGFWERMVQCVKDLLRRNLGKAVVDYEELYTLLCDCESLINSRPLTYIGDDTLRPLTPDHFLKSIENSGVEDIDSIDHEALKIRLKYVQKVREDLRQRFRSEYLSLLVQRGRSDSDQDVRVGEVVLIETPEKRINWPLGLIQELKEGRDGVSRVAKLKTRSGICERPVQRLHQLELRPEEAERVIGDQSASPPGQNTRCGRPVRRPVRFRE